MPDTFCAESLSATTMLPGAISGIRHSSSHCWKV
jgi:hypothetical protein